MRNDVHILVKPETRKALNIIKGQLEAEKITRVTTDELINYLLTIKSEYEEIKKAI